MAGHFRTPLITGAMQMAAKNHPLAENYIAHSDHGSNYTSRDYAELLDELGLSQSLGRTSICYDNAAAESFFATLKKELLYRTVYPTREKAMRDIARCMRKGRTTKERNR
jgi:putative transposase